MQSWRIGVLGVVACAAAAVLSGRGMTAQQRAPVTIFDTVVTRADAPRTPGPQDLRTSGPQDPRQSRIVRPRLDALADAGRRGADVGVALPGLDIVSRLTHFEAQAQGFFAAGPITRSSRAGAAVDGEVSFTVVNGTLAGRIVADGRLFRIFRIGSSDLHQIEEIDLAALPPDGQPLTAPETEVRARDSQVTMGPQAGDSSALVDMLVMYTPAARLAMGGTAGIQVEATAAVNNANLALQNSGVSFRYRMVFLAEISYTESGSSSTDLSRLRSVGDGYLDEVHGLRDYYKADVVSLLIEATDFCGVAYVMGPTNVNTSFNALAFNVTARSCANGNLSLAHEAGHNLGLQHDRPNAGSSPSFDFAYGYAVPGVARDVMAYACTSGGSCPRRAVFSSPNAVFPSSSITAGTATEDNARALNLTSPSAANFRDSSCTYTLSTASVSVGTAGGTGTIGVTSSSGCAWTATSSNTAIATITGGSASSGSGTVSYSVGASASARSTTLTVAGQTVSVTQADCAPSVTTTSSTPSPFGVTGGTGVLIWTFPSGCESSSWSVAANETWLSFTSATSGTGSGSASFTVAINTLSVNRGVNLTLGGAGFTSVIRTILQRGPWFSVTIPSQVLSAAKGGAAAPLQAYSAQQGIGVTIDAVDARAWTATSDQPWLEVVNGSGTGSGTFYIRIVNPNNVLGASVQVVANVTVAATGLTSQVWPFTLNVRALGLAGTPFGFLDTPLTGSTVAGAIPVTGWALGSENITRVDIWRDAVSGDTAGSIQTNGWVYIGQAAQVTGARPDVAAAFPSYPLRHSAGWGYLLLTNMLPNRTLGTSTGGQGAFRLHATATQTNGVMMELGEATINVDNEAATKPFGALDTPSQGGTASSLYANFGWALAKGTALIPTDGSTMAVFIDGVPVGRPAYNQCRGTNLNGGGSSFLPAGGTCDDDIATLFGPRGHLNVAAGTGRAAIGSYVINTTALTNGLHSIAWSVTDDQGRTEGIGSRNFIVSNGATDAQTSADTVAAGVMAPLGVTDIVKGREVTSRLVQGRRGFDLTQPWEVIDADAGGARFVRVRELDRVEFDLGGPVLAGYLMVGPDLVALPVGSYLDARGGRFTWAPAAGFLGRFDLVFLTATGRVPVSVDIVPRVLGPEHDGTRQNIDEVQGFKGSRVQRFKGSRVQGFKGSEVQGSPSGVRVEGWALDPQAWHGAGVGAVHIWVKRVGSGVQGFKGSRVQGFKGSGVQGAASPVFLGAAELRVRRPDVAAAFGAQFDRAGFRLESPVTLPPGDYEITAYVWAARTGRWEDARTATLVVGKNP